MSRSRRSRSASTQGRERRTASERRPRCLPRPARPARLPGENFTVALEPSLLRGGRFRLRRRRRTPELRLAPPGERSHGSPDRDSRRFRLRSARRNGKFPTSLHFFHVGLRPPWKKEAGGALQNGSGDRFFRKHITVKRYAAPFEVNCKFAAPSAHGVLRGRTCESLRPMGNFLEKKEKASRSRGKAPCLAVKRI